LFIGSLTVEFNILFSPYLNSMADRRHIINDNNYQ
jgi:hypothetical protein